MEGTPVNTQLELPTNESDIAPLNRIRVETALSRFPIHRLAKKGTIAINLLDAQADFKWEVTYNVKHGQPGPLAYKVDTLVINRKLDEATRPLPKIIRLGSLHEIAQQISLGGDTNLVRKALHQNASAYVEFSIRYRRRDGSERELEQGDNRYGVVFTGDKLPGGKVADAVYLILHDWYRELLEDVAFRPLDYDYLKELPPGAQRFYELLSFQTFGALAGRRPRAKLLYSDYCTHAPQVRYLDWERARKQMYKIHAAHLASGYIAKVVYQEIRDAKGNPDWEILYTPGPKAWTEYRVFTNRKKPQSVNLPPPATQEELPLDQPSTTDEFLIREMTGRGITHKKAQELLVVVKPGQEVLDQLEYTDFVIAQSPSGKFHNPPGLYIRNIEQNITPPAHFETSRQRRKREEIQQAKDAERARRLQQEIAYEEYERAAVDRFIAEQMAAKEYRQLIQDEIKLLKRTYRTMIPEQLEGIAQTAVWSTVKKSGRVPIMAFNEFCTANT
jgi:hypothetical protein